MAVAALNSRQRLLSVLHGQIPDRVPVVAFIDGIFLVPFLGRTVDDLCADVVSFCRSLGFDAIVRVYCQEVEEWQTSEWWLSTEIVDTDGITRRVKTIETVGGVLREVTVVTQTRPGLVQTHTEEYLVKTRQDLALMERYRIIIDNLRAMAQAGTEYGWYN